MVKMNIEDDPSQGLFTAMSPALWCQAFFIIAAAGILFVQGLPEDLSGALLSYGARSVKDQGQEKNQDGGKKTREVKESNIVKTLKGLIVSMSDYAQVPHHWFLHFYILAVSWSAFWALQYVQRGSIMRAIATRQAQAGGPSMELGQVFVAWTLMSIQGLRRLYESLFITKSGSSPMFIAHWLLGVVYYTVNLMSAWVEGSGMCKATLRIRPCH
jgi:3-oxo-5-alpha-steroid 4-dehydrogenase 3